MKKPSKRVHWAHKHNGMTVKMGNYIYTNEMKIMINRSDDKLYVQKYAKKWLPMCTVGTVQKGTSWMLWEAISNDTVSSPVLLNIQSPRQNY